MFGLKQLQILNNCIGIVSYYKEDSTGRNTSVCNMAQVIHVV